MERSTRAWVLAGARVALAHHPLCSYFDEDVLRVGRVRVCSGCALAFPALVAGLALGLFLLPGLGALALLAGGLALGVPQLASYAARRGRIVRGLTKLVGGLGLGLVLVGILALPMPWTLALLAAMGLSFLALQALRMRSIWRTCQACPWRARWEACPGFVPHARDDPLR